jgi:hypothetical protein
MNYLSNLNSNYTMLFFNVQSVEEADTLLHAENHESQKCRTLFAKCVAETAQNGDVRIYVEGSPEGKLKYSDSFYKKQLQIDGLTHDANISLDGWDYMGTPEATEATDKAVTAEMNLRTLQQEKKFLGNSFDRWFNRIKNGCGSFK